MRARAKGISPIVATILMVAVAVAVGILITNWATSWVGREISRQDVQCATSTNYVIESARWNYSSSLNQLLLKVTNKNTQKLYNFSVTLDNITRVMTFNSTNASLLNNVGEASAIKQEESIVLAVNLSMDPAFGSTLSRAVVLNEGCKAISAPTTNIEKYTGA